MNHTKNQGAGFISLLGAAMLISFFGIAARFLGGYFGYATATAVVEISTFLVLGLVMYVKTESFRIKLASINKLALAIFCLTEATSKLFFIISVTQLKATNTVFYLYMASFVAAFVVAAVVFKEKPTRRKIAALVLAFVGLVVFSYPVDTTLSLGVIFGLLAGASDTTHFTAQQYLGNVKRHTLLVYSYLTGSVFLIVVALLFRESLGKTIDLSLIAAIPVIGVVFLLIGETAIYGFNNFPIDKGTIVVSGELFFAIVLNALVLHENPTATEFVGACIIFAAIVVVNFSWRKIQAVEAQTV